MKDYSNIGDLYLKHIEESTVKKKNQPGERKAGEASAVMRPYYMYLERRIFNAITKMIVRPLTAIKTIYMKKKDYA